MDNVVRAARLGLVGSLIALASLVPASPAMAAEANPMPCPEELAALLNVPDPTGAGIVIIGPSIEIHPENASAYAGALTSHLVQNSRPYVDCLAARPLQAVQDALDFVADTRAKVDCAMDAFTGHSINPAGGYFRYASVNYETGAVAIHQSVLLSDVTTAQNCLAIT